MRALFLVLVFANVAFFAWRYFADHFPSRGADPVAQQLQPERIKLVTPEELARMAGSRAQAGCIELGPIPVADARRAEEAVTGIAAGLKVSQRRADEPGRWWVYIPPLPTRQAAVQRAAELRKQGVEDSSLISDDPQWRNAISLGVFRSEDAAAKRADELRRSGVRGVEMAPRESGGARVYVQLRDAPEPVRGKLAELKGSFPGAEIRECPR
ncbi:MAG TPA: SPOR domain-containing protein [Burkholderiales bacterium]|nr:SPOR domain-containing protein [Burkholderiales bacterium]